ncbi:MAG TPA: hypothetical protein VLQ79_10185 [Myxococcaceae bacterium]|nr:hypothetical protein [Myxococcaceae bacterium]
MTLSRRLGPGLALLVGCAHGGVADAGPVVKLTLRAGPGLRVEGKVGAAVADVRLAVEEPRSLITVPCLGAATASEVQVRLPLVQGGWQTLPEVQVGGVTLGSARLPQFRAAVVPGTGCMLWLGLDVLGRSVLDLDLDAGTVLVTRDAPTLPAALEQVQVEVTRDPDSDRLLLAAQLTGTEATVLQTLMLATGRSTELGQFQARLLGAESVVRIAQLAPGWEACDVAVKTRKDWTRAPPIGVLGPEAWGARRVVIDLAAARMTLARPKDFPAPPCRQAPDAGSAAAQRGAGEREPR